MAATVPGAPAKDREVRVAGSCTGASSSKLNLSDENGRIEVEFDASNRAGKDTFVATATRGGERCTARASF